MHILRNSVPLPINYGQSLPPGEWLCQDEHAFQWAMMAPRGTCELRKWNHPYAVSATDENPVPHRVENESPKSILLIRSGAIGDLLLLSPCIAPLKEKYPQANIEICCFSKHGPIIEALFSTSFNYPAPVSMLGQFDLIIPLENIIELSTEKGQHATDAFAEALGVTVVDYKPVYRMTDDELIAAKNLADSPSIVQKPRLGLQIHPSSQIRSYPMQHWNKIMVELLTRGWEIMLLGQYDAIKGAPPAIKDCSSLSFREAAAVLATCDVFLGPDSSFFNLCPALGVPAIGLFGPVDWGTRVKEGSGQYAIGGVGECAPCGWTNSRAGQRFPAGGPCNQAGHCVPLAEIEPARVIAKVDAYRK